MISTCSGSNTWTQHALRMRTPDDAGLAFSNIAPPPDQFLFVSDLGQHDEKPTIPSALALTLSGESQPQDFSSGASSDRPFAAAALYPLQTSFAAANANAMHMGDALHGSCMSPPQTRFNSDAGGCGSYDSTNNFSADDHAYSATSTTPTQWSYAMDREPPTSKRRPESVHGQMDSAPARRRRSSDKAEPGSARAVYLEKNRHAASKCRTKQKRQQEDLVETARDAERKNKVLKSEVELLKSDLRGLMELVGQHHECPDGRLRTYLQLEADRLSQRGNRSTVGELRSPKSSVSGDSSSPGNT
ncbi:hypothetical protein DPSP01_013547 [Paraphaeosphaeria sporulosa]|uniref:BZIP domain-containing protein n=1 Tax=Paraphaeosphaeria sporulosa TaxID=1460663 RepID=A0A177C266_9PLEO|nr:uncharacterized protein CC84DRAFT_1168361 [Paraphaeosphaeria sporulosa]OAG01251.1 hypothetical protein CC84DRAFT_1168361 [Paraphaeosphaeria sporulosa]